jgi:uncharacterized integral membrane protein (TIGR00698 family)
MAHPKQRLVGRIDRRHTLLVATIVSLPVSRLPTANVARIVVPVVAGLTLLPAVSSGVALILGVAVALTLGNPWPDRTRALAHRALTWSVVGLGAGMNLAVVGRVGLHGLGYTALGIGSALVLGTLFGRALGVGRDTSLLVTVGTAICGGSAIAAVAPAIGAKDHDVSMALVTVFLLNAIALFLFPAIGHALHLGQDAFGLWCALAIHDTSSVVGAAGQYGERALEVATAAKLARALWIVPVTFAIATLRSRAARTETRSEAGGPGRGGSKRAWFIAFIAGFVAVAALVTFVPALRGVGLLVASGAHRLLAATLFLMGLGLSRAALRSLGFRPLLQAVALWIALGTGTLGAIVAGWIS